MKLKFYYLLASLILVFGCYSCSEGEGSSLDTGRISLHLVDAPFPTDEVAEANVTIFKVEARQKDDDSEDEDMEESSMDDDEMSNDNMDEDSEENKSPYVVLMEEEITVNLLELINGNMELLADAEVPAGSYDLIRIYIKDVNIVLNDGSVLDFKVPSGSSSGLKVFIKPALVVAGGLTSDLILDFDVCRSFVKKGNGGFNFKPVIKAANMSVNGSLMGMVSTQLEDESLAGVSGAQVTIMVADTINTTTLTAEDGSYMVLGLPAGSIDIEVSAEGYLTESASGILINAANKTTQDFTLLPEE